MDNYKDAAHLAALAKPHNPVFCARADAASSAAQWFAQNFPGATFYAVKANPAPWLLDAVYAAGVRRFEVASIAEVRLVAQRFADAEIAFMHPVKSREAIAEAYHRRGVRIFALDTPEELTKILEETNAAPDLTLCVRCAVSGDHARISLARKFGARNEEAVALLQTARQVAVRLGVSFHVGSQTMAPAAYVEAIDAVEQIIVRAGVIVDVLDVGGGFPVDYPGMIAPPLADFVDAIAARFEEMLVAENCALWCEPGRAIAANAASLVVRVEARKGGDLYVNDGAYGALFDAAHLGWRFPVRALNTAPAPLQAFSLYGPTCDDIDYMEGPFHLPADIAVGDYIEIGALGAYGAAMASRFNGFGAYETASVEDAPMAVAGAESEDGMNETTDGARRYGL